MKTMPVKDSRSLRVLFLGDVVGRPGRQAIERVLRTLKQGWSLDLVIANGENSAGGAGIDAGTAHDLKKAGVDLITLGDTRSSAKELLSSLRRILIGVSGPATIQTRLLLERGGALGPLPMDLKFVLST